MIRPARQEEPNEANEASASDAPETLRFPPRERATTVRRPDRNAPFDLQGEQAHVDSEVESRAALELGKERAREIAEREDAIRQARAALAGAAPQPDLAAVVWDAHEAIIRSRTAPDDAERPQYVPIAHASRGITAKQPIEALPASVYVAPYNLPERSVNPRQTPLDLLRRVLVSGSAITFLILSLLLLAGGGTAAAFGAGTALLAPLAPALLMWPVMALGLTALAAHEWVPDQLSARRQRSIGVPVTLASLAGIAWCLTAASGQMWGALLSSLVLFAAAWEALRRLNLLTARTRRERWLTDAPVEFALGFSAFVTAWTASAVVTSWGWALAPEALWASLTLLAVALPVCLAGMSERGRIVPALAFAWGAVWLMAARIFGDLNDPTAMVLSGLCAVVALLTALARRQEISHTERVALQGYTER